MLRSGWLLSPSASAFATNTTTYYASGELFCSSIHRITHSVGGGNAEYVTAHESHVMIVPEGMDYRTAATIPETWLTAFQLLFMVGDLVSVCDSILGVWLPRFLAGDLVISMMRTVCVYESMWLVMKLRHGSQSFYWYFAVVYDFRTCVYSLQECLFLSVVIIAL